MHSPETEHNYFRASARITRIMRFTLLIGTFVPYLADTFRLADQQATIRKWASDHPRQAGALAITNVGAGSGGRQRSSPDISL
jgi:hypothetical protein